MTSLRRCESCGAIGNGHNIRMGSHLEPFKIRSQWFKGDKKYVEEKTILRCCSKEGHFSKESCVERFKAKADREESRTRSVRNGERLMLRQLIEAAQDLVDQHHLTQRETLSIGLQRQGDRCKNATKNMMEKLDDLKDNMDEQTYITLANSAKIVWDSVGT
tara:strand:+ start:131 stop:613 length:483 start_codon:yes stop_codon:yes gene_type:complete